MSSNDVATLQRKSKAKRSNIFVFAAVIAGLLCLPETVDLVFTPPYYIFYNFFSYRSRVPYIKFV